MHIIQKGSGIGNNTINTYFNQKQVTRPSYMDVFRLHIQIRIYLEDKLQQDRFLYKIQLVVDIYRLIFFFSLVLFLLIGKDHPNTK